MMLTVLDRIAALGTATVDSLWVPALVWTVLTVPTWAALRKTGHLPPHVRYRLSQVLLAALPASILVVAVTDGLPGTHVLPHVRSLPPLLVGGEPIAFDTVGAPSSGPSPLSYGMHAIGLATIGVGLVALGALARLGLNAWATARVRATASPARTLHSTARRLAASLGLSRRPRVAVSPEAAVPLTLPGWPPVVLLPDAIAEQDKSSRMALAHEFVHLRRYDDVALLLERLVAAVCAAHPLVWGLRRSIDRLREQACDAAVLRNGHATSDGYARLLATVATGPNPCAGALSLSDSSSLIDRLRAMRSLPSSSISPKILTTGIVAIGVVLTLGVAACSDSLTGATGGDDPSTSSSTQAQSSDGEVYVVVEEPPELKGGMEALQREVTYPDMAREAGIEGRVFVQFVVGMDGSVQNPRVTRDAHKLLNQEALRAVKAMEFEPGKQRGEPVRVKMSLPVVFQLPGSSKSGSASDTASSTVSETDSKMENRVRSAMTNVSYPRLLRKSGVEGRVVVTFTVGPSGQVSNPQVVESAHEALDAAALQAVRDLRFDATGQSADVTLPMTFSHSASDGAEIRVEVRNS